MQEVSVTVYEAFDGKRFDSPKACRDYEAGALHLRLANLTPDQVKAALARTDLNLSAAFEDAGLAIRAQRRLAGDFRLTRAPKTADKQGEPEAEAAE